MAAIRFSAFVVLFSTLLGMNLEAQPGYAYTLKWGPHNEHTYYLELETMGQTAHYTDFRLPVWRPGRYLRQDFAAALSHFQAFSGNQSLRTEKLDISTWRVHHPNMRGAVRVSYRFYANTLDAGNSYVGEDMAYFNPVNMFVYVDGRETSPVTLKVPDLPAEWKVASSMAQPSRTTFTAASYHELADSPTLLAPGLRQFSLVEAGVKFHFHFTGNYKVPDGLEQEWLEDIRKIIREQVAIFGGLPPDLDRYHFIYLMVPLPLRHAVEHAHCSMYVLPQAVVESREAIRGLYGITSHEFWHLWNVKRIRPAALWPYDYSRESYTSLHWFTEGVTEYYTNLILARAGLFGPEQYANYLSGLYANLGNSNAAKVISPAQSSFDCWLGTSDYQVPWLQTSFYSLGARAGLLLDLEIRSRTNGQNSFDDVFVYLYNTYYLQNKGFPETGVLQAVNAVTGKDFSDFFETFIAQPNPGAHIPAVFQRAGIQYTSTPNTALTNLQLLGIDGLKPVETGGGWVASKVRFGSDAFRAGLADGDVILKINQMAYGPEAEPEKMLGHAADGARVELEVLRLGRIRSLSVQLSEANFPKVVAINPGSSTVWKALIQPKAR